MEENEWQPVRIAPLEITRTCPQDFDDGAEWPVGRIVRARVLSGLADCGTRQFEIHPEDNWGCKGGCCEHQILAD